MRWHGFQWIHISSSPILVEMARRIFFLSLIFEFLFKYETIETHASTFLTHTILSIGTVLKLNSNFGIGLGVSQVVDKKKQKPIQMVLFYCDFWALEKVTL